MPKEQIENPYWGRSPKQVDGGPKLKENYSKVVVGWTKLQCAAQIGVVPDNEYANPEQQQWMDLDREGINRLIRALRKARDESFGKDA